MLDIKPTQDWVILEPLEIQDVSAGGIVLLRTQEKVYERYKVVAVGDGRSIKGSDELVPMQVKVGQIVYAHKNLPNGVILANKEYKMIRELELDMVEDNED
jgi:chaperonin GroES